MDENLENFELVGMPKNDRHFVIGRALQTRGDVELDRMKLSRVASVSAIFCCSATSLHMRELKRSF